MTSTVLEKKNRLHKFMNNIDMLPLWYIDMVSQMTDDVLSTTKVKTKDIHSIIQKYKGSATHIWNHENAESYVNNLRNDRF